MTLDPDSWWASLPHARRAQICRWITADSAHPSEVEGQSEIFDVLEFPAPSKGHHR